MKQPLAPYMVNPPRDRRVQVGQSIQLTTRVASNPWAVAKWFKDQEQWQEAEEHTRNLNPTTETAQVISEIRRRQAEAAGGQ